MTDSDVQTETWKPIPGAGYYEASDLGRVRSIDRHIGGRFYKGQVLKPRPDGDGYLVVNITYDGGERKHGVSVARLVLLTHDPDGYAEGLQACHGPGGQKDNSLLNLRWDTDEANRIEALGVRLANHPPKVKPPKVCPRCGAEHRGRGQRCHACVVQIGVEAAPLIVEDDDLDKVAEQLDYPSGMGVYRLARKYGGLRHYVDTQGGLGSVVDLAAVHSESPELRSRSVLFRLKAWLRDSD